MLKSMNKDSENNLSKEKRVDFRKTQLRNYRIEIKLDEKPIYQFRVTDVNSKGAGILIKEDSAFLSMIQVGQIVDADFISIDGAEPAGTHRVEIQHVSKPSKGKNRGHCLVGLSILEKIEQLND